MMIIPNFIKKGDCIGVTAPSDGIIDRFGLELFSGFKASPYNKIYEFGKTAVERFGNDPKTFKKTLGKYKPENFKKTIKQKTSLVQLKRVSIIITIQKHLRMSMLNKCLQ